MNFRTGKKDMMMTPLDFYASITPDCSMAFGVGEWNPSEISINIGFEHQMQVGSGVHVEVTEKEVGSGTYYWGKSPSKSSLFNK